MNKDNGSQKMLRPDIFCAQVNVPRSQTLRMRSRISDFSTFYEERRKMILFVELLTWMKSVLIHAPIIAFLNWTDDFIQEVCTGVVIYERLIIATAFQYKLFETSKPHTVLTSWEVTESSSPNYSRNVHPNEMRNSVWGAQDRSRWIFTITLYLRSSSRVGEPKHKSNWVPEKWVPKREKKRRSKLFKPKICLHLLRIVSQRSLKCTFFRQCTPLWTIFVHEKFNEMKATNSSDVEKVKVFMKKNTFYQYIVVVVAAVVVAKRFSHLNDNKKLDDQ